MSTNDTSVRTRKEIKQKLLKKAIEEGRGPEMMLLIQWRLQQVRHDAEADQERLEETLNVNKGQPRSIKMLNALALHEGSSTRYVESSRKNFVDGPQTLQ